MDRVMSYLVFFFSFHLLLLGADSACNQSFPCGNFEMEFPFTNITNPGCGLIVVNGCASGTPYFYSGSLGRHYSVLEKITPNKYLVQDTQLEDSLKSRSCLLFRNLSMPQYYPLSFTFTFSPSITLFTCFTRTPDDQIQDYFKDYRSLGCQDNFSTGYYYANLAADLPESGPIPTQCSVIQLPLKPDGDSEDMFTRLTPNFTLEWSVPQDCFRISNSSNEFDCKEKGNNTTLVLAITIPVAAILIFLVAGYILWQRKKKMGEAYLLSRNLSYDPSSKSDLEDGSFNFGIPIFSYTELVEATCNFDPSKELGDGGFGTVYYGKLRDGREVAIKRLYEHNYRRVEQFLNEIRILTCLRHPNLVSLYGCTSRKSRELLLVYEYIPNGTVADHLHGERAKESPLTWHVRMCIARETAAALAYLHKSDIVHRDVKTNNILLDSNFSVKVADFGLSRLFPTNVTHISTAPQGTPGYVDPEYHQCYQLTDKSDVYSFGVVLIELISSMPAVDISRHKHEINLANLAVNKIQRCAFDELIDPSIGYNSDDEVTRMSTSVAELAFRCLQLEKDMRPSMEEVVAFLHDIHTGQDGDGNHKLNGKIPPSPETDEAVLLKSRIYQSSPTAVIDTWISCSSTTASSVG